MSLPLLPALAAHPVLAPVGVVLLVLVALALLYPNTIVGSKIRSDVPVAEGGLPILGHQPRLGKFRNKRLERLLELMEKQGEVVRTTFWTPATGIVDILLISNLQDVEYFYRDPYLFVKGASLNNIAKQLLGNGIFTSDGHEWKTIRKTASNIFNVKNFRDVFAPTFMNESVGILRHLSIACSQDLVIDLQDLLLRSTLDSFAKLAMGSDVKALDVGYTITDSVDAQGRPQKKYTLPTVDFMEAFDLANAITASRGANPFWRITEARNGTAARMEHAIKVMDDFAAGVIAQKRKSGVKPGKEGDMLDLFMSMKGDGDEELTDAELRDHVLNFIIAGRDTTAQTLSWAVYEVSQHPEIERKLRAEILSIVGKDREIVYDDLKELKYTNAVFNETLRLHANVPAQARRVTADCVLPGTGTKVYKDQLVQVSSWAMGHLERIWGPDAKEFRPERWIDEKGSLVKVNNFQWPVFNAGPRLCLGLNMATQEGILFLANIIRNYSLEVVNEDKPSKWGSPETREGRYVVALTLGLRDGLEVKVHPAV